MLGTLTGRLGDPTGRDTTRPVLDAGQAVANAEALLALCHRVLLPGFGIHRNHTFVASMDVPELLTRLASRVTVARMLSRDGFRRRVEAGAAIGIHELIVPLLQGWDSVVLRAQVEIGGHDQLFNFQIARHLQRAEGLQPQACLMVPLLQGHDGQKMSKSAGNAVFVDDPPAELFGQILSVSDPIADHWRTLLTDLPPPGVPPLQAKKALAHQLVALLHGAEAADQARAHFERTVQGRRPPEELQQLPAADLITLIAAVRGSSRGAARRLLSQGAVAVDGVRVDDPALRPAVGAVLRIGRRCFVQIATPDGG